MPRGRVLTEETKKKIQKLIIVGLSDTEIGAALKISSDVVHKLRKNTGGKKDGNGRGSIKNNGSEKTDRERGAEAPGDAIDRKESREPEHHNSDDHTAGGKITFTGGKKHQQGGKTDMSKESKEESFEWECPFCHHQFNGSDQECPKCGKLLQE
jgi:rubrerythrin